jgi:hypothetical protein
MPKKKKIIEKVSAFEGEQDFIVNSNKPDYIEAGEVLYVEAVGGQTDSGTGQTSGEQRPTDVISDSTDSITGTGGATGTDGKTGTGGATVTSGLTFSIPDWSALTCDQLNTQIGLLGTFITANSSALTSTEMTFYSGELTKAKSQYATKCTTKPPIDIPLIPDDWSKLLCTDIEKLITSYNTYLADTKVDEAKKTVFRTELTKAKSTYDTKCKTSTPTTTVTTTTTLTPPFGGGFFGGGGGGGATSTSTETNTTTEKKQKFPWLIVILIAGGLYLLTRKSNKG